jgi:hypothetical protein
MLSLVLSSGQTQLISQGGFEVVGTPWATTNAVGGWWNYNLPANAHSGNRYVYLGRASDGTTTANNVEDIIDEFDSHILAENHQQRDDHRRLRHARGRASQHWELLVANAGELLKH